MKQHKRIKEFRLKLLTALEKSPLLTKDDKKQIFAAKFPLTSTASFSVFVHDFESI